MSIENIDAFYKHVLKNPALLNGLAAAADAAAFGQQAVAMGKAAGFDFSGEEAQSWIDAKRARQANGELDDEELEAVAGGKAGIPPQLTNFVTGLVKDGLHQVQNAAAGVQASVISRNSTNTSL